MTNLVKNEDKRVINLWPSGRKGIALFSSFSSSSFSFSCSPSDEQYRKNLSKKQTRISHGYARRSHIRTTIYT